jgi:membrane-associated phospholipid phosphatase
MERKFSVEPISRNLRPPPSHTSFTLPIFLNRKNKTRYCVFACIAGGTLYLLSNHFLLFPARTLPMNWPDQNIPFIPETVWIYNSDIFLFVCAYIVSKDMANLSKYLYSFLCILIFCVGIFFIWPTVYPRGLYPLSPSLDPWTQHMFTQLREVDSPANCFPSLHVSVSYISAFIFIDEQREKFPYFLLWATLVALSTLTTKQHYLADVLSGTALAMTAYFIFHRVLQYNVK